MEENDDCMFYMEDTEVMTSLTLLTHEVQQSVVTNHCTLHTRIFIN